MLRTMLLLLVLLPGWAFAQSNTHGTPNAQQELQAWMGDRESGYVLSGCLPTVPSSSLTYGTIACKAYVGTIGSQLTYIDQPAKAIGPLSGGNGTYWLGVSRDTTSAIAGCTRQAQSFYFWCKSATIPAASGGMLFNITTVSGGVITASEDIRTPRSYALERVYDITDPLYGGGESSSAAVNVAALQAAAGQQFSVTGDPTKIARTVRVPPGRYAVNAMVVIPPGVSVECTGTNVNGASSTQGAVFAPTHDGVVFRLTKTVSGGVGVWHDGAVSNCGFDGLGASATTASRFIELGDPANVDLNHGAWRAKIRNNLFNNSYGYGIYSAHSQEVDIEYNQFLNMKYPIYWNTVVGSVRIRANDFVDNSLIPNALAIQMRLGTLGGASGGTIENNYFIGFREQIWLTSIFGTKIHGNTFESAGRTAFMCDKYLSDAVTADGSGCWGLEINNNNFILWARQGDNPGFSAIQLNYTAYSSVGVNSYTSPSAAKPAGTFGIGLYDGGTSTSCGNILTWPFINDGSGSPQGAHLSVAPMAANSSTIHCNTIIGRQFIQTSAVAGDALSPTPAWSTASWGAGEDGRLWWDNTNKRFRVWSSVYGATTVPSILSVTASLNFGATAANTCDALTTTVTGAAQGEEVILGVVASAVTSAGEFYFAYVSATDTVSVKRCNVSGSGLSDPAALNFKISVVKR